MDNSVIKPELITLIQGIKPYLGNKGQIVSDGLLSVMQLVTSEQAQQTLQNLDRVLSTLGMDGKNVTISTASGRPVTFSLNSSFILFLIPILLLLSGNFSTLNNSFFKPINHILGQSTSDNSDNI